jgi:hypothetical protein
MRSGTALPRQWWDLKHSETLRPWDKKAKVEPDRWLALPWVFSVKADKQDKKISIIIYRQVNLPFWRGKP